MEKLESMVPDNLQRMIAETAIDDLHSACSSLLDFFLHSHLFHDIVGTLADGESALCAKDRDAALQSKRKGNEYFLLGDYTKALSFYSQALRVAPIDATDMGKNLIAVLYVNRASVFHKMGLLVECLRDCDRALTIFPGYAKAWYRRGKTNASLENYEDAVHDLNLAMNLELSLVSKRHIETELKSLSKYGKGTRSSLDNHNHSMSFSDELTQTKLECISTPTKGRGMISPVDVCEASLVHTEEPYAAVISKQCRETHCHYCFNELPADTVPCVACSAPWYCSEQCQLKAGGQNLGNNPKTKRTHIALSSDQEKHTAGVLLGTDSNSDSDWAAEHRHECKGVNWPAVLPSEIILAGRVLVKSIVQSGHSIQDSKLLELSHNYAQIPPKSKMELHIYAIVLLYCLWHSHVSEIQLNGEYISQLVILMSQIRVNSMAVIRVKSADVNEKLDQSSRNPITDCIQQVRVGQGIYLSGSLFNHSCKPNIHAYFLSRTLLVRSTVVVAAGHPLELSYGPQLGQFGCKDRQQFLEDQYSFRCQCSGCLETNLSDLVINAFRCVNPYCFGVVLDSSNVSDLVVKKDGFLHCPPTSNLGADFRDERHRSNDISGVAHRVFEPTNCSRLEPGICLSCDSYRDMESSHAAGSKAGIHIRRLQEAIVSNDVSGLTISKALNSLNLLRSTFHAYNKVIAEAEDNLAQALCLVGELQLAMDHCKASIEILEKLYGPNHIVIGYELVKLSTIQLSLGDCAAAETISRLGAIFSCYYGSHADTIFPYLQCLKREASKHVK